MKSTPATASGCFLQYSDDSQRTERKMDIVELVFSASLSLVSSPRIFGGPLEWLSSTPNESGGARGGRQDTNNTHDTAPLHRIRVHSPIELKKIDNKQTLQQRTKRHAHNAVLQHSSTNPSPDLLH